ncbi:MAG: ATP-binding cassette domain-containing protein [Sphaerochaetaceae bacterium]|nr:ATP-binding cassette domain-containing protein [Sphaerochaetaceae bacterium]
MELEIHGLQKRFSDVVVFDGFDCSFLPSAVNVLSGASGCGKTTFLRILMGLDSPDAGNVGSFPQFRISAVFQEDRLCDNLSPVSNVRLVTASTVSRRSIQNALEAVGLGDCLDKPARELSGGMRRRVALVRALLADYDVLLLDEPFKGLDDATKERVIAYTRTVTEGRTVILVTHDLSEATAMNAAKVIPLAAPHWTINGS